MFLFYLFSFCIRLISSTFTFEMLIIDLTFIFESSFFITHTILKYLLIFVHFILLNDLIMNYMIISFQIYFFMLHLIYFKLKTILVDFRIILLIFSWLPIQDFVLFYWTLFILVSLNHYTVWPFFESIY